MAASGSNSFDLADAFVPEHRALDGSLVLANNPPGARVNDEPLHRMPIFGFTGTVPDAVEDHARRCLDTPGGRAAAWNAEQQAEFVWRFTAFRERRAAAD